MKEMKTKQNVVGFSFLAAMSLCALMVAGCSKPAETTAAPAESGSPGAQATAPGGMQGGGMPGGGMRGRGAPVAENASGAEVYQAKCGCHGTEGKGGRGPALAGSSKSDDDLYKIIHDGRDKMPAFGSQLTEAQIKKVVTYLKQLKS
jgi:mono/diheme cytochrome c family protein